MNLSILTVQYRSTHFRPRLLKGLRTHTRNFEYLERTNDYDNVGFSKANNELIRKSKGKYIVLLNPDSEVTEQWADGLVRTAEADPTIGIVCPKLLQFNGLIDSTGHDYSKWPYAVGDRGEGERDIGQYDHMTELISCNFGAALLKRELVSDIGLLDERFFLYNEDVEYCHRARKAGWKVIYCPTSIVFHERHGSGHNKWMDESRRQLPYILRKYYPPIELAKWYIHKVKATLAGIKNQDISYTSSNFKAIIAPIL